MKLAVTFARMQPPTIAHEALVNMMKSVGAHEQRIYLSESHDSKTNPIDFETRLRWAKKVFEDVTTFVSPIPCKDFFDMLSFVGKLGFSDLHIIVGGDRYEEISKRAPMYNGKLYNFKVLQVHNFKVLQVHNFGDRDNSSSITGMSASKMREAAKLNDYAFFENGLPKKLRPMASDIFEKVRQGCARDLVAS